MKNPFFPLVILLSAFQFLYAQRDACLPVSCRCETGLTELQLYYFGEPGDVVNIDVYSDNALSELIASFPGIVNGGFFTVIAAGLPDGVLPFYTFFRITNTVTGVGCTTRMYSQCPRNAWPGSLEDLQILGKTFGYLTVYGFTSMAGGGTTCSLADTEQFWRLGGNIVTPAGGSIGTKNAGDLIFITNNQERGRLTQDGRLGLNNSAPQALLHVGGAGIVDESLDVHGTATVHSNAVSTNSSSGALVVAGGAGIGGNLNAGQNLGVGGNAQISQNGVIGQNLTVGNSANISQNATIGQNLTVGSNAGVGANLSVTGNGNIGNNLNVGMNARISGNVQVGSAAIPSGYMMSVDGRVICEELRVRLSGDWPDYVFTPEYELMSLTDLEKSILENGHLPNVPPANVLEREGVSVGEMQRVMMEKIEELTLYIIQQQKELNQMKAENQVFKNWVLKGVSQE